MAGTIKVRKLKQLRTFEVALAQAGFGPVAGVDEAGRGSCAGPITLAACILPPEPIAALERLTDSKQLTAKVREELFPLIKQHALAWSILHLDAAEIDQYGLQRANIGGMRRAVALLEVQPAFVLTDAMVVPGLPMPHLAVIGGDAHCRCIAAASVLAKVSRDRLLTELDAQYPGYGLKDHKGYGTKSHLAAVRRLGGSPIHRYTYANVQSAHAAWQAENQDEERQK